MQFAPRSASAPRSEKPSEKPGSERKGSDDPRPGQSASNLPAARAAAIAEQHLDVIWRMARRLGVPTVEIEDMAQEVLVVVVRRLEQIQVGKERAFVASTTVRVASNWRRSRRRRPEDPSDALDSMSSSRLSGSLGGDAEQRLERSRRLARLTRALDVMTEGQREAFILFDLEQLTAPEIAEQLGLPEAAVVSRVRRAREVFQRAVASKAAPLATLARSTDGKHSR
jgi:RNA polymerase sigma-70 factor (ECF subfamily)